MPPLRQPSPAAPGPPGPWGRSALPNTLLLDDAGEQALEREIALAFRPLHKAAMGVSIGLVCGLLVFLVTAVRLLVGPAEPTHLALLAELFAGYRESWTGAVIGMAWACGVGFILGWFAAFVHNLVVATWLFLARVRAELTASRDILDHI